MSSNEVTKATPTKKALAKPTPDTSHGLLKERLEFVLTCIEVTGTKIDFPAVAQHYGISTNAAKKRLQRAKDCVARLVEAREAALQDENKAVETTEDEEA
ncbi:uncharacterized protein N7500_002992 [Penicillium coprophilum]|uniref:uncharacterized protein n=1 Tax=Penicillium coprophilum TaxID=36646 RepID=UPI00238F4C4B|nr:uncharacterized protein N7500_002992 [Penicillium coprophilum]KAJ5170209.1 hypothetical protein N7500_002992 [Penicillium coprophilum]